MKVDSTNIVSTDLSECLTYKLKLVGISSRKGSDLDFNGQEKCSGYNINKYIYDGMTVNEYQSMIKQKFNSDDPQFSLTKHLKYDIQKGFIVLVR